MSEIKDFLKPFTFHGVELTVRNDEAIGQCPFCGREKKFSVNKTTGQWRCFVCAEKGNVYSFLQLLWEKGVNDDHLDGLREERGLVRTQTLVQAGVRLSPVTGEYIVPGYNVQGKLSGLYVYRKTGEKYRFQPTAEVGHHLFQMEAPEDTKDRDVVYLCEKPWDAMVLWEMLGSLKLVDGKLIPTSNRDLSLLGHSFVVSTHSCNVFQSQWAERFAGKRVCILFDNDHPMTHPRTNEPIPPAAFEGVKRVTQMLAAYEQAPKEIHYLQWGVKGYDPKQKSGLDVRDLFMQGGDNVRARIPVLTSLFQKIKPIPTSTLPGRTEVAAKSGGTELQLIPCHTWKKLINGWRKALHWTPGLDRALSVMLASITSTKAVGDQLWIKIIGPPASGKSTLCEALSTSRNHVVAQSTIRGFHSGYKSDKSGTEDNSLIASLMNKTLITKDGDTLLTAPNLAQILAEARDIYDRTSRTHYRHGLSRNYEGLNMTWLLCGTASLRQLDDSELGQRFIDCVIMEGIDLDLERSIARRKAYTANRNIKLESDGKVESRTDPDMTHVMQLTGGYVEYLRANANELLNKVQFPDELLDQCVDLGIFVAYMRARPSSRQKEKAEREFGTRLTSQFVSLANCLAVVLNTEVVNEDVMNRVRQIALDTARGRTMELARHLHQAGTKGLETKPLSIMTGETEQNERELLRFLRKIGAVDYFSTKITSGLNSNPRWRLSDRMQELYQQIVEGEQE